MKKKDIVIVKEFFQISSQYGGGPLPIGTIGKISETKDSCILHALNDTWSWMKNDKQCDWLHTTYKIIDLNNKLIRLVLL